MSHPTNTSKDTLSRGARVRDLKTGATGRVKSLLLTTRTRSVFSNRFVLIAWDHGETFNALPSSLERL